MSSTKATFTEIEGVDGVYVAHAGKLSCTAVRLKSGGLCLYSPVAAMAKTPAAYFDDLGDVTILLAPNHYHNKGLSAHRSLFPNATMICSDFAEPRLKKITGLEFANLEKLEAELPDNIDILQPQGLKTGEVWLQIKKPPEVVWIVCDAFSAERLRQGEYAESPALLGTFPNYGIQNQKTYREWVERQISDCQPTLLLPCHGSPVRSPNLGASLLKLLNEAF